MSFDYCTLQDVKSWLVGLDVSDMPSNLDDIIKKQYIPWAKREVDRFVGENFDLTTINEFYDGSGSDSLILRHRPVHFVRNCVLRIIPQIEWFQFKRWFHLNHISQRGTVSSVRGGVEPNDTDAIPPYKFIEGSSVPSDLQTSDSGQVTATFNNTREQYEKSDLYVDTTRGILQIPPRILFLENQAVPFWNYTWLKGTQNIEVEYDYGYENLESLPDEVRSACAQLAAASVLANKGLFAGAGSISLSGKGGSRSFGESMYASTIKTYIESAKASLTPHQRIRV